jgi:hypothetical protein
MNAKWILGVLLAGAAVSASPEQGLNPEQRRLVAEVVTDLRYDQDKFIKGLQPAADLKLALGARRLVDEINEVYGWSLPENGFWTAKQGSDVIYDIVSSPKYRQDAFLSGLEKGAPLLRELRERRCIEPFNRRYGTTLPESGGLTPETAEVFLYEVAGREELAARLDEICPQRQAAPPPSAAPSLRPAVDEKEREPTPTVPTSISVETETRGASHLLWLSGGIAAALLAVLILKVSQDLRRR